MPYAWKRLVLAIGLLAVLTAGCTGRNNPANDPGTESISGSSTTSPGASTGSVTATSTSSETLPTIPRDLVLDNCSGWQAYLNYPGSTSPGERPEGWEEDFGAPFTTVSLEAYYCNRVSIGPFERGPLHLLIEQHSNIAVPPNCRELAPGVNIFLMLSQLWVDDQELATFLHNTLGISTLYGQFASSDENLPAGAAHTWSWNTVGGASSTITIYEDGQYIEDGPLTAHYFWQAGDGLGRLDLIPTSTGEQVDLAGNGSMAPPTIFASDLGGVFVGPAEWHPTRAASGEFTLYSDLGCEYPRS